MVYTYMAMSEWMMFCRLQSRLLFLNKVKSEKWVHTMSWSSAMEYMQTLSAQLHSP